jgi:hypothetical protein
MGINNTALVACYGASEGISYLLGHAIFN